MTHPLSLSSFELLSPRSLSMIAGALTLSISAATMAGPRGPEFPISVAEARDRAEARFKELDADGSGDISPAELAAAPKRLDFAHGNFHRHKQHARSGSGRDRDRGEHKGSGLWLEKRESMDAELFERLDKDGDGALSREEFNTASVAEARREAMQERVFARLDQDGSGGLTRDELPDMSRRLAAMDADGDGLVTREEARAHRETRREARRAEQR